MPQAVKAKRAKRPTAAVPQKSSPEKVPKSTVGNFARAPEKVENLGMALFCRHRNRRGSSSHLFQTVRRCAICDKLSVGTCGKGTAAVDQSNEVESALARNEGLKLTVPPGFKALNDVVSAICSHSALSKTAAVERLHAWLRSGEVVSLGVPIISGSLAIALNPDPRYRAIPRGEWRDMELEYRGKPLSSWVAKGIDRPSGISIGAMGTLLEMERTRPRYSRLIVEEIVIERLVREFPKQAAGAPESPQPALAIGTADGKPHSVEFTTTEAGVLEAAHQLWKGGISPRGMRAGTRNKLIADAFRQQTGGGIVGDRTIRKALSKAGIIRRRRAS